MYSTEVTKIAEAGDILAVLPKDEQGDSGERRSNGSGHRIADRHSDLWLPSHCGRDFVALQPQNQMVPESSALNGTGDKPVPEWEPSQKG